MELYGSNAGNYKTYDTGLPFMALHHGNTFKEGDLIHTDVTTFDVNSQAFNVFNLDGIKNNTLIANDNRF